MDTLIWFIVWIRERVSTITLMGIVTHTHTDIAQYVCTCCILQVVRICSMCLYIIGAEEEWSEL